MASSYLTGFLKGFGDRTRTNREQAALENENRTRREMDTLKFLATSDDPEIQAKAIQGMVDLSSGNRPKRGFFDRLVGTDYPVHPAVSGLLAMMREPQTVGGGITVSEPDFNAPLTPPPQAPGGASAAMPAQSTLDPGGGPAPGQLASPGAPATPAGPSAGPPAIPSFDVPVHTGTIPFGTKPIGTTATTTRPRQLFLPPDERMRRTTLAKSKADVEGEIEGYVAAGMTRDEALQLAKSKAQRSVVAPLTREGEIVQNPDGTWEQIIYDARTGSVIGRLPAMAPMSRSTRGVSDDEQLASELFGAQFPGQTPLDIMRQLTPLQRTQLANTKAQRAVSLSGAKAGAAATAQNAAMGVRPLTPIQSAQLTAELRNNFERYATSARTAVRMGQVVDAAYAQLESNYQAGKPIGAQSQAVVQSFARILDELSSVREAEYERTPEGQSLWNRFQGEVIRLKQGGAGLGIDELRNIIGLTREIVAGRQAYLVNQARTTEAQARTNNLNIDEILTPDVRALMGGGGTPPGVSPPPGPPPPTTPQPIARPTGGAPPTPTTAGGRGTLPPRDRTADVAGTGGLYTGEVRKTPDGRLLGRVGATVVELVQKADGKYYVK